MPCFLGCLSLGFPRLVLFLVWLFGGNYLASAFSSFVWPLLGFLFLPLTTLAFVYATHSFGAPHGLEPFGWILVGLAAAADLGLIGGGGHSARRWRNR
jgi:hypothetical protein